jgi:hypothetical protein
MNISNVINRLESLEGSNYFNSSEMIPLEEKVERSRDLFEAYYNSIESEQQEFLEELNLLGGTFTHQEMIDIYKSFGTGDQTDE